MGGILSYAAGLLLATVLGAAALGMIAILDAPDIRARAARNEEPEQQDSC
jgi:hypothetical protein